MKMRRIMKFEQGKEHKTYAEVSERDIKNYKTERMDSKGWRNCYRK